MYSYFVLFPTINQYYSCFLPVFNVYSRFIGELICPSLVFISISVHAYSSNSQLFSPIDHAYFSRGTRFREGGRREFHRDDYRERSPSYNYQKWVLCKSFLDFFDKRRSVNGVPTTACMPFAICHFLISSVVCIHYSRGRSSYRGRGRGGHSGFYRPDRGPPHMMQQQMHAHGGPAPAPDQYYNHPGPNQVPMGQSMAPGYHEPNYDMQANRYAKLCLSTIIPILVRPHRLVEAIAKRLDSVRPLSNCIHQFVTTPFYRYNKTYAHFNLSVSRMTCIILSLWLWMRY